MTVKDCIALAMTYAGLQEKRDSYLSDTPTAEATATASDFLMFIRSVINEIALGYAKLTDTKRIEHSGGTLKYSDIHPTLYEVLKVTKNGERTYPKKKFDGLDLPKGKYEVEYAFLPQVKEDNEIPFGRLVSGECVAYGTAAEYFLSVGMAEEATAFDDKFKNSLCFRRAGGNLKVNGV